MKVLAIVALLFCGALAQDGPKCQAPNGGGLAPVLREFVDMIPVDQVLEILLTSMTSDPETQAVMEYLSSEEFHGILLAVRDTAAFNDILKFTCYELYFDGAYYINYLLGILGFPEIQAPRGMTRAGGFNAMLQEILALIPLEQMKALLESKLQTDYYLQLAFQKINSDEFGAIIETLQSNGAYNDMKSRLRGYGVDVDGFIDTIGKLFRP